MIGVLVVVSIGTFFMVSLIPGDPAVAILGRGRDTRTASSSSATSSAWTSPDPTLRDWAAGFLTGDLGETAIRPTDRSRR